MRFKNILLCALIFLSLINFAYSQNNSNPTLRELYRKILFREGELENLKAEYDSVKIVLGDFDIELRRYYQFIEDELQYWEDKREEKVYTVQQNDNLWRIAAKKEYYGDGKKWWKIYKANQSQIKDPNLIYTDQKFTIPDIYELVPPREGISEVIPAKEEEKKLPFTLPMVDSIALSYLDLELQGMVVDETQSKIGKDFFDLFFKYWQSPDEARNLTITITEKPLPRLGSQVTIMIDDNEIISQFLQPKYEVIEEIAEYCVEYTYSYIQNYELIMKELQGNDMKGTGIF